MRAHAAINSPQSIDAAGQRVGAPGLFASYKVVDDIPLEGPDTTSFRSLAGPDLAPPVGVLGGTRPGGGHRVEVTKQSLHGDPATILAAPGLRGPDNSGRDVGQPAGCLHLVAVLASRSRAAEVRLLEIGGAPQGPRRANYFTRRATQDRDRDGRAVHPAVTFSPRDPLDPVAPGLRLDFNHAIARYREDDPLASGARIRLAIRAALSIPCFRQPNVGAGEFRHEDPGVAASLPRPYLDSPLLYLHLNPLS